MNCYRKKFPNSHIDGDVDFIPERRKVYKREAIDMIGWSCLKSHAPWCLTIYWIQIPTSLPHWKELYNLNINIWVFFILILAPTQYRIPTRHNVKQAKMLQRLLMG